MNRRDAAKLVAGAMLAGRWALAAAPKQAGVRFSFMLWALQKQAPFDRVLEMVAEAGYQGVELVGEFQKWAPDERVRILAKVKALGLVIDSMSGVKAGFSVPAESAAFLEEFAAHVDAAVELRCPQVILLSGKQVPGLADGVQRAAAIENLKRAAAIAAKKQIEIVIEPIDLLEQPGCFLATVTDGFEIAKDVNAPNLKVLYDLYHEQRSFGNLIEKLEKNIAMVGLIHVADVPGRHEPGTGEINFPEIYERLAKLKYDRWIAMEYYPTGDVVECLKKSREQAQASFARA
jgi:hydroxypyruvate isomerase